MRSILSQMLAHVILDSPHGWTLCGLLGVIVCRYPATRFVSRLVDYVLRDKDHCYKAMLRSIKRAGEKT